MLACCRCSSSLSFYLFDSAWQTRSPSGSSRSRLEWSNGGPFSPPADARLHNEEGTYRQEVVTATANKDKLVAENADGADVRNAVSVLVDLRTQGHL